MNRQCVGSPDPPRPGGRGRTRSNLRFLPPRLLTPNPTIPAMKTMEPASTLMHEPHVSTMGHIVATDCHRQHPPTHTGVGPYGQVYPLTQVIHGQRYPPTTGPQAQGPHQSTNGNVIYQTLPLPAPSTANYPASSQKTPHQNNNPNLTVIHPASQQTPNHCPNTSTTFTPPSGSSGYQQFVLRSNCQPPAISKAYFDACGVHPGTDAYQELVDALGQARHQIQSTESTDPQPCKGFDPFWDEHS